MDFKTQRQNLVATLQQEGIKNQDVLNAINTVPREDFVPNKLQDLAYANEALPIGESQTISQPYVVARMTECIYENNNTDKVLEIGTGSGYQAAILSLLFKQVYSIERIQSLLTDAEKRFKQLGYKNIKTLYDDGNKGWQQHAPYNAIIVTAGAEIIPKPLLDQLADNGRLMIPVGAAFTGQELQLITRKGDDFTTQYLDLVAFVPLLHGKS